MRSSYQPSCLLGTVPRYPAGQCAACRREDKCRAEHERARERLARLLGLAVTKAEVRR